MDNVVSVDNGISILDSFFAFFVSERFYLPIIYILIGIVLYNIIIIFIKNVSKVKIKGRSNIAIKRKKTIMSLIKNIIKYLIGIFVIIAILEVYDVDTSKIIASLGIAGVVIGLAFQDLVKDLIAGVGIIFDNQYTVGDYVEINGFIGEIIEVGLKTTKIKAYTGEVKIISNSAFNEVTNYNMYINKSLIDIPVSYNTNIEALEKVLKSVEEELKQIEEAKGEVLLLGINELADSSIVYRIAIECGPYTSIQVKRKAFAIIKGALDKAKIEIPYNKLDVYLKK